MFTKKLDHVGVTNFGENSNRKHETRKLFDVMYIWFLYNIYRCIANRARFVEALLYE